MADNQAEKTTLPFALQDRDRRIIESVWRYQYLQTRQILQLAGGESIKGIRRRLRKMVSNGYLVRLDRSKQLGIVSDHAYTLGNEGLVLIAFEKHCHVTDLPFSKKAAQIGPQYLHHAIMVNDLRILVEQALEQSRDQIEMTRWISENELANPTSTEKAKKYVLYELFKYDGQKFHFNPDAAFFVYRKDIGDASKQMMFCLEADRGTEAIDSVIRRKVIAFNFFHREAKFRAYDNCGGFKVLFIIQAPTDRRIVSLCAKLSDMKGGERLYFALQHELTPENFFSEEVWFNYSSERVSLLKKLQLKKEKTNDEEYV